MKCIIIDDEPIARKGMKRLMEDFHDLELIASFDTAESAETWLSENHADLIFLDIEMPGMNGIDFARRLPKDCMVIFTTAYSDYALDSYEVEAIDYLVKPIKKERFSNAVSRANYYKSLIESSASNSVEAELDYIIVKSDRKYVRLRLDEILYVEGLKDYVIIHMSERKIVTRMTVKVMGELLPAKRFLRVSKSYIVNRKAIDAFDNNDVFIGSVEIPIGISYRDSVLSDLLG